MPQSSASRPLTHYAVLSMIVALATLCLKVAAWRLTGSVGLLSDALETLVNLVAAGLAYISLWVAARPADDDHAYGHTKVEYFASGMEGTMILMAAIGISWSAIDRLFHPLPLNELSIGLTITAVAAVINWVAGRRLISVGKKRHSVTLEADGKHLITDVWTSAAVIVGVLLVALTGWQPLDSIVALLVAVLIVFIGIKLVHQALLGLMDTGLPEEELKKIREVFARYFVQHGVEYHALRTRQAGAWKFMSVHVLVPGDWTVTRSHELVEKIEEEIRQQVERINVLTHLEPLEDPSSWEDVELERRDQTKAEV